MIAMDKILRQIERFPNVDLGRNFGLGDVEVGNYMTSRTGKEASAEDVQEVLHLSRLAWIELNAMLRGLVLPQDYAEFLVKWGGLEIGDILSTEYNLRIFGIGPFVQVRIANVIDVNFDGELALEDNAVHTSGMFQFSTWRSNIPTARRAESYCLDVRPGQTYGKVFRRKLAGQNGMGYSYTLVQPSFSAWLVKLAQTNGDLREFAPEL